MKGMSRILWWRNHRKSGECFTDIGALRVRLLYDGDYVKQLRAKRAGGIGWIATAPALAEKRCLAHKGNFIGGDAKATGLASEAFDGLMSIDAIMFVEPSIAEILRMSQAAGRRSDDGPLRRAKVTERSFRPILKRAGLPIFELHELRHTHASLLAAAPGLNPKSSRSG